VIEEKGSATVEAAEINRAGGVIENFNVTPANDFSVGREGEFDGAFLFVEIADRHRPGHDLTGRITELGDRRINRE